MPLIDVPTVHAVTDRRVLANPEFLARADAVMRALGPGVAVHVRGSELADRTLFRLSLALVALGRKSGSLVVVNGRPDIAAAAGAGGVQLGRSAPPVGDARGIAAGCMVGVSIHSAAEAQAAMHDGADWVIAGHVFATPAHSGLQPKGIDFIRAVAACGLPVIAIGGIAPKDAAPLRGAGAHGIAAIRGIWDADDPGAAASSYLQVS